MGGCGCCRMSGKDRRLDLVFVHYSEDEGEGKVVGSQRADRPNSVKLNSGHRNVSPVAHPDHIPYTVTCLM